MTPNSRKKLLTGIGALAGVIILAVVIVKLIVPLFVSPAKQFIEYHEELVLNDVISNLEERLDALGSGQFSSDITITGSMDDPEINSFLEDSSICLKLDVDRNKVLANGELTMMGSPVMSAAVTYDEGRLGLYLPEVEDTYYVMDLAELVYTMTGEQIEFGALSLPQLSGEEWGSLLRAYLDVVYTAVNDENVEVERSQKIRLEELGGSVTGKVYTFTPRAEDVEDMLTALADHLREDENLRSAILKTVDLDAFARAIEVLYYGSYGGYDIEGALDDALVDLADMLEDEAADIGDAVEDSGFSWTLGVDGGEVCLIRLEMDEEEIELTYERGGDEKEREEALYAGSTYGDAFMLLNSYEKDGSRYIGETTFTNSYGEEYSIEYDLDEEKTTYFGLPYGEYAFSADGWDGGVDLVIEEGENGVDHTLRIQDDSYLIGGFFSRLEVTVNTTDKSTASEPKAEQEDISSYSEDEMLDWLYNITDTLRYELYYNMPSVYD